MGSSRDDFSPATLRAAAGRVGYRCSFPGCKHVTIGPSMESNTKTSNIGVGAHICAAAAGGPRYDPSMSSSERKSMEIFERLYKSGWVRRGLKKDYAYVLNQNGKTEAAKRLLREEYDENLDPTVLQELIHLRLYTNDYTDDEYFRALSSYCDSKSMFLAGEVSLRRKEYQQAYDFFLRSLLADESYKPSYFGIFNLSIQNKLPQIDANGRDKKIVVLENHSEARRIAIHAPNILRGITPTTFASCEHFSIENPAVSCLVFCKAQDTVVFENRQYTVKTIIPLQEEVVKTCYEVVLNDPNVIKIRGNGRGRIMV